MRMLGRHFYRSAFGLAQVFDDRAPDGTPIRILKVGGVFQSATYLGERRFDPVFEYYRAFDAAFQTPASAGEQTERFPPRKDAAENELGAPRILIIGGGGYAWPKHVLATRPDARLDVVEIDPVITEIARKHFFVDEAITLFDREEPRRMRTICADGREFLERIACENGETQPYAAVVNDAFSGVEPVRSLASVEAARLAKAALIPEGLYLTNVVSEDGGRDLSFLRDTVATLLRAFEHVHIVPCPDGDFGGEDNYLLIATDGAYEFEDAIPFDEEFLGSPIFDRTD